MRISVSQAGNSVEVSGFGDPIRFDVTGLDLPPLQDHTFAAWLMLPWAMKTGEAIEIDGPVDPLAIENIRRFSNAWELWEPSKFNPVTVVAASRAEPTTGEDRLTFYSGGLDSTDMLLQLGRQPHPGTALTVHGFDYPSSAGDQFAELRDQVAPFLEALNYRHVTLSISRVAGGRHSYALRLAAAGFLFSGMFSEGILAADANWEQDMALFPWGLNHVTDRYLKGKNFRISTVGDQKTRPIKAKALLQDKMALQAVSFCKRRAIRPKNCGTCSKCVRTKIMFSVFGDIPEIFVDNSFDASLTNSIDIHDRNERVLLIDLYQIARDEGLDVDLHVQRLFERLKGAEATTGRRWDRLKNRLFGPRTAG
ncbi:hypothetical protein [Jannaschia rubra]|uniref:Uncharacterized protein n=1 Tax=Jannaschia rubra TaxID=282197 RepID=A0A0M6XX53_9RHOB|nr:hypothetical protein [Jannaschia rubra]CTQ34655.1 hypothetical protein JAN5088_03451 [Jannaschia rubra]SFG65234.1 hypothetical protein SAMN04488517_10961 [Jannaschia rubra]